MMPAIFILINLLSFAFPAFASTATFTNPIQGGSSADPNNNEVYTVGDSINVTWSTDAPTIDLVIWQDSADSTGASVGSLQYMKNSSTLTNNWYLWNIQTDGTPLFDLAKSNIFAFSLYAPGSTSPLAGSSWFNLTNSTVDAHDHIISTASSPASTQTPTISSTTTSKPTSSSTSSPATTSSTSQAVSPTSTASPPLSGLSTLDKTGTGIGVGIGVPLLLAALAIVFLLMRRKTNIRNHDHASEVKAKEVHTKSKLDGSRIESRQNMVFELP